mmetsp:Transcript_7597/g.18572  ORF Transcript_7597/g.18572 Transcript_7597/m.18572 type:complete len:288 (+) Transcript_7597:123-986(+)
MLELLLEREADRIATPYDAHTAVQQRGDAQDAAADAAATDTEEWETAPSGDSGPAAEDVKDDQPLTKADIEKRRAAEMDALRQTNFVARYHRDRKKHAQQQMTNRRPPLSPSSGRPHRHPAPSSQLDRSKQAIRDDFIHRFISGKMATLPPLSPAMVPQTHRQKKEGIVEQQRSRRQSKREREREGQMLAWREQEEEHDTDGDDDGVWGEQHTELGMYGRDEESDDDNHQQPQTSTNSTTSSSTTEGVAYDDLNKRVRDRLRRSVFDGLKDRWEIERNRQGSGRVNE